MYKQSNYKGLTFAEVASKINNKYRNRADSITQDTMKIEFSNLANKNDVTRQASPEFKQGGEMYRNGGEKGLPPGWAKTVQPGFISEDTWNSYEQAGLDAMSNITPQTISTGGAADKKRFSLPKFDFNLKSNFSQGDQMNLLAGALKSAYYTSQANRPVAAPRFNTGFDEAKSQINQMRLSTQAEQNQRVRNRNAYIRGVEQNAPNAATRLSNLQGIYAQDDMNTSMISQKQQQLQNQVRERLGQLAISQGQDRQQQLAYRDAAIAERDKFKHTGANLGIDQLAKTGNTMNHYRNLQETLQMIKDLPSDFDYGTLFNLGIRFANPNG
jgi:hypothetical protein